MGVGDGHRQGVRHIVGFGGLLQVQQFSCHINHLVLFRIAVPHHRLLDLHRGIFKDRDIPLGGSQQDESPGLGHVNAGGDIVAEVQLFKGDRFRMEPVQQVV